MNSVLDSLAEHIAVVDREGWIVAVNRAWERFAQDNGGVAERCNEGANYLAVCREARGRWSEGAAETGRRLSALLADESDGFSLEYPCPSPRRDRWFLLYAAPLRGNEGGAVLSHIDITARVQAERALQQRKAELQRANEALRQRTDEAERRSAELRAMTVDLTRAEHRERRRIALLLHEHLQQILVAAKMRAETLAGMDAQSRGELTGLMDEAIDISRDLSQDLCPAVLYDRGLAAALNWLAKRFTERHKLAVEVEAAPEADPRNQDLQAFLFHAVQELLLNAVKHGGAGWARITMHRRDGELTLDVTDDGIGCEPDRLLRSSESGGFGLFSIRERLSTLGGSLQIQTAPGRGFRVTLRLTAAPMAAGGKGDAEGEARRAEREEEALPREPSRTAEFATGEGEEGAQPIRVMLVDDHRIVREGLAGILQADEHIELVAEASDGREAVERVAEAQPDVVVMDVSMPHMNGIEATRRILHHHPEIRVIGLSMHDGDDLAEAMRAAGAAAYLTKGGPANELISAIREPGEDRVRL